MLAIARDAGAQIEGCCSETARWLSIARKATAGEQDENQQELRRGAPLSKKHVGFRLHEKRTQAWDGRRGGRVAEKRSPWGSERRHQRVLRLPFRSRAFPLFLSALQASTGPAFRASEGRPVVPPLHPEGGSRDYTLAVSIAYRRACKRAVR